MWYVQEETTKNLGGVFFKRQRLQKEGLEQTTEKISAQHRGFFNISAVPDGMTGLQTRPI